MGNEVINEKLFRAVENGEIRLIKEVLQEEKLNATCYYGAKSILTAVEQGETEILTTLLEHSKNVNRESFWSRIAFSALRAANDADNKEVMALLLKYGAGSDKKRLEKALANETQSSSIDTTQTWRGQLIDQTKYKIISPELLLKGIDSKKYQDLLGYLKTRYQ